MDTGADNLAEPNSESLEAAGTNRPPIRRRLIGLDSTPFNLPSLQIASTRRITSVNLPAELIIITRILRNVARMTTVDLRNDRCSRAIVVFPSFGHRQD